MRKNWSEQKKLIQQVQEKSNVIYWRMILAKKPLQGYPWNPAMRSFSSCGRVWVCVFVCVQVVCASVCGCVWVRYCIMYLFFSLSCFLNTLLSFLFFFLTLSLCVLISERSCPISFYFLSLCVPLSIPFLTLTFSFTFSFVLFLLTSFLHLSLFDEKFVSFTTLVPKDRNLSDIFPSLQNAFTKGLHKHWCGIK